MFSKGFFLYIYIYRPKMTFGNDQFVVPLKGKTLATTIYGFDGGFYGEVLTLHHKS